jgi:ribosomal-protein-alanine N-acetyltransferase
MPASVEIRLALPEDAHAIAALSREAIEHGLPWRWTPQRVRRSLRDRSTNVIVSHEQGVLHGFAIMKYDDEEAHLLLLAVAAAQRHRHIGSTLMAWLDATTRAAGIAVVRVEARASNTQARSFYRHHGFRETGIVSGYYEDVEDAVRMRRDLRG